MFRKYTDKISCKKKYENAKTNKSNNDITMSAVLWKAKSHKTKKHPCYEEAVFVVNSPW